MKGLSFLLLILLPGTAAAADASNAVGTWCLNGNSHRLTLTISGPPAGPFTGSLTNENGGSETMDNITWDPAARRLEFRRIGSGFWQWYRGSIVEGILAGRFSHSSQSSAKPALTSYAYHVTGWNGAYLDSALAPRVYEALFNTNYRGVLRIDSSPESHSGYTGRLKMYSTVGSGAAGEEPEYDLEVTQWNGATLSFIRHGASWTQTYTGTVKGRTISGTYTQTGVAGTFSWNGARAQVLSYGFGLPKGPIERTEWQDRTRRRLFHLMMGGNPTPASATTTVLASNLLPFTATPYPPERDDNPSQWPQNYRLTELRFDYSLPNPYGGAAISRSSHAYMAVPTSPPPPGGRYPAVLALNGHGGSAWRMLNGADGYYWYGEAFARRGFAVLAVDISHRPVSERSAPYMVSPLYGGALTGDDSGHGNGSHPAVKAAGFDSDWEEDGERAWDAMRALDYLLAQSNVDGNRVLVTGLSMGGEIATIAAALDPRLAMSIPAGFSADLGVILYHGNHPCWRWLHADIREYVDTSDFHALTAPRPLVVETGRADFTFSQFPSPFAADKQVIRRSRVAYGGETGNLVHYLHYDQHHYHIGDVNPTHASEQGVRIPEVIQPTAPWSLEWQTDDRTFAMRATLFDLVAFFLQLK